MKKAQLPEAQSLYVRRGLTMEEIAKQLSVSTATIGRWAREGDWAAKRAEWLRSSAQAPLDKLRDRRLAIINKMSTEPTDDPTFEDRLVKLTTVIEKMEAKAEAIGPALDTMERFTRFAVTAVSEEDMKILRRAIEDFLAAVRREQA